MKSMPRDDIKTRISNFEIRHRRRGTISSDAHFIIKIMIKINDEVATGSCIEPGSYHRQNVWVLATHAD